MISIAEYACCKFCKSKVVSEAALKRQGLDKKERQAVRAKCEKQHRDEEIQQFLHYKIVLFLFMNAACLLCQKLHLTFVHILHSDQQ